MGFTGFWAVCWGAEVERAGLEERGGGTTGGSQMGCQKCIGGGSSWIRVPPLCQHCLF